MKRQILLMITGAMFVMGLFGCGNRGQVMDGDGMFQISQDDASTSEDENYDMTPIPCVQIMVGDDFFSINMEDNTSAEAFVDKVNHGGLTIDMHDYGSFEKVGDLPWELPTNDEEITTVPGDLILYQGNKITVYYDENTWNFTKLGHINATEDEIKAVFGGADDITAESSVEWTE